MTPIQGQRLVFTGNAANGRFAAGGIPVGSGPELLRRDPGTGLLDQHGLTARLRALAGDRSRPFAVVLLNVESVLTIARNLGRDLYEAVISTAAAILSDAFEPTMVGRLNGEDFIIIHSEVDETRWPGEAHRIVALLSDPVEASGIPFSLDPAAGVALYPEHGQDLGTLVAKAEMAMSEARQRGEPACLYHRQSSAVLQRRRELLTDLHGMLSNPRREGELAMAYQPQVDLQTRACVGVEALLRWTHPEWGGVNTQELVAAIEQSEVMHQLTERVIDMVTSQLGLWARAGMPTRASINVSINDLHRASLIEDINAALRKNRLAPEQLTVEITEGIVVSDPGRVQRAADNVRALGVGLSLDDFGTGYASLRQLRQIPLTEVKIDRSYVGRVATDPAQRAIVTAIVELARSLRLDVVAEGIEDEPTVAVLGALPQIIGQGWHFGRPMTPGALVEWWRDHQAPPSGEGTTPAGVTG